MKRITAILFAVGLLLEFAGFFGDQSANIPFVLRLVAPRYTQAQAGLDMLAKNKILEPDQRGFSVLSELFLARLCEEIDPRQVAQTSVHKFTRGNAGLSFSTDRAKEVIPINVTLSNGKTLKWELSSLSNDVDALQNQSLFWLSLVVFFAGVTIQCVGFALDFRESRKQKSISETTIEPAAPGNREQAPGS